MTTTNHRTYLLCMTRASDVDRLASDIDGADIHLVGYIKWHEYVWARVTTSLTMDYFDERNYFVLTMRSLVREEYADIDGDIQHAVDILDPKKRLNKLASSRRLPT